MEFRNLKIFLSLLFRVVVPGIFKKKMNVMVHVCGDVHKRCPMFLDPFAHFFFPTPRSGFAKVQIDSKADSIARNVFNFEGFIKTAPI